MIFLKFVLILGVFVTLAHGDCPLSQNPKKVVECLRYITSALYGVAMKDLAIICSLASDIANCARRELGDCIAAEIGRASLMEIQSISENCCPNKNDKRCPIRDNVVQDQRCFAADSLVTLADGRQKSLAELRSGDLVHAYNDATKKVVSTPVLTMLDKKLDDIVLFKALTTVTGRRIVLTSSHLLLTVSSGYVQAKDVRLGMNVYAMHGNAVLVNDTVSHVTDVIGQGYVAPLTNEGTLIVDGIAASCYGTMNNHYLAHGVLAPMRWWYGLFGSQQKDDLIGIHWFPKALYEVTTFLAPSIVHS